MNRNEYVIQIKGTEVSKLLHGNNLNYMNVLAGYKGTIKKIKNMFLSNRTKNYVKISSSCNLFDTGGIVGTAMGVVGVVVGERRRVVVLAACLGAIRVKPCGNPDPLVNNLHELSHAPDYSGSISKAHTLFSFLFSLNFLIVEKFEQWRGERRIFVFFFYMGKQSGVHIYAFLNSLGQCVSLFLPFIFIILVGMLESCSEPRFGMLPLTSSQKGRFFSSHLIFNWNYYQKLVMIID